MFFWIAIGLLIIMALASYAGYLLFLVWQQKQDRLQKAAKLLQENIRSIDIIARAMLEKQCDIAEGVLRLAHLIQQRRDADVLKSKLPALFAFQEKIQHQPIGKARKKLSKQERMRFDFERMRLESTHQDAILEEVKHLQQDLAVAQN